MVRDSGLDNENRHAFISPSMGSRVMLRALQRLVTLVAERKQYDELRLQAVPSIANVILNVAPEGSILGGVDFANPTGRIRGHDKDKRNSQMLCMRLGQAAILSASSHTPSLNTTPSMT